MISCHPGWNPYVVRGKFIGRACEEAEVADAFSRDELLLVSFRQAPLRTVTYPLMLLRLQEHEQGGSCLELHNAQLLLVTSGFSSQMHICVGQV